MCPDGRAEKNLTQNLTQNLTLPEKSPKIDEMMATSQDFLVK
jgi:hypothetical protein